MERQFEVRVKGTQQTRGLRYPPSDGPTALRLMNRLFARDCEYIIATTSANGFRENLSLNEMRQIYGDWTP